jgi:hypothetical protein
VEKENDSGRTAVRPPDEQLRCPGDRAHVVPLASGARSGDDNNGQVGAALRARRQWLCGHGSGGKEGRREARWR